MSTRPEHIRCLPGFLFLLALALFLCDDLSLLAAAFASAAVHELGHIAAAAAFGGRAERLTLSLAGAELRFFYPRPLTYGRECLVALAGPCANLLAGAPALWSKSYLPAAVCFGLGAFNLLPVLPLDGGVILFDLLAPRIGPDKSEWILAVCAGVLAGALLGLGAAALVCYANATLLLVSLWLLGTALRRGAASGFQIK